MTAIQTHPQASLTAYVHDKQGNKRRARLTSKQYIITRMIDLEWHPVREFTRAISDSGFRARLAELRDNGYEFERRGRSIRLTGLPGCGTIRATA